MGASLIGGTGKVFASPLQGNGDGTGRGSIMRLGDRDNEGGRNRKRPKRATAYRYFSSPEQLQNEAALDAIAKRVADLPLDTSSGLTTEDAVAALIGRVHQMSMDHETAFRTMLRLSLDPQGSGRGGRRVGWIDALLDRAGIPKDVKARATPALSLLCGIEAHIVLNDVCGLTPAMAREILDWAARTLTRAAMEEAKSRQST